MALVAMLFLTFFAARLVGVSLPPVTFATLFLAMFLASALVQFWLAPAGRNMVWGFAAFDMVLFTLVVWSVLTGYPQAESLAAPIHTFLFFLIALRGLHGDPRLVLVAGGAAAGARLSMSLVAAAAAGSGGILIGGVLASLAMAVFAVMLSRLMDDEGEQVPADLESLLLTPAAVPQPERATSVLIAEDSSVNMMILTNMLSDRRFDLTMTEDGLQAVERFREMAQAGTPPDIVLLDIEMPELDGCDAAKEIRKIESDLALPPRPLIAVTALGGDMDKAASLAAGMDDHLVKPVQKQVLLASITHALSVRRRA